ncbi:MAG: hypothetical protein LUD72_01110 [Bacteroidales bacterium]|nr:hypothetical protein [Bacteroidales bacterium]
MRRKPDMGRVIPGESYGLADAADRLGIDASNLWRHARGGDISHYTDPVTGRMKFTGMDILAYHNAVVKSDGTPWRGTRDANPERLDRREAARRIGIKPGSMIGFARRHGIPYHYHAPTGRLFYLAGDIDAFLQRGEDALKAALDAAERMRSRPRRTRNGLRI